MKAFKKFTALLLALSLTVTMFVMPAAAEEDYVTSSDSEITLEAEDASQVTEAEQDDRDLSEVEASTDQIADEEASSQEEEIIAEGEEETKKQEANGAAKGETVSGTFDAVEGYDIATIRYFTDASKDEYKIIDDFTFNEETNKYEYSFEAPFDGFTATQESEFIRGTQATEAATIIAEYFNENVWDGAVDVSWYSDESYEFEIYTPAQFAGVSAIVDGSVDINVKDYMIKGQRIAEADKNPEHGYTYDLKYIENLYVEEGYLAAGGRGPIYMGVTGRDFKNKTIYLMNDLNMGGASGAEINHAANSSVNSYDYPNWMCIGGQMLADVSDRNTMVEAYFNGVIDGCGHDIYNLYCFRWAYQGVHGNTTNDDFAYAQGTGLVGIMGILYAGDSQPVVEPGIRNLGLSGYIYGRRMVGGIIGCLGGGSNSLSERTIVDVDMCVENTANHAYVYCTDSKGLGGIIGIAMARGSIINCYNDGYICADYPAPTGGIIGANEGMDIFCCYNTGTINSNKNTRGRGIGGDNAGRDYTVDNCYYRTACGDDPVYPGYYTYNMESSIYVNVEALSVEKMTNGTLLSLLNVNGNAYVQGADGYPDLFWEHEAMNENCNLQIGECEGGSVGATSTGYLRKGSVVYLGNNAETGWNFRYYTWNGKQLSGDYVFLDGDGTVAAYFESSKAGVLKISDSPACIISVTKNGMIIQDGQSVVVEDYPVKSGDSLFEGDVLVVDVKLVEGALPEDENLIYKAAADLANPYLMIWTYTTGGESSQYAPTYTVTSAINEEDASLFLTVEPQTSQKLWSYIADSSWYNDTDTTFVIENAAQLAGLEVLVNGGNNFAGKTIKLGNDIDMTNIDGTSGNRYWDGIGTSSSVSFAGTFDGQGYTIDNFHGNNAGLFGYVKGNSSTDKAVIKNFSICGTIEGPNACGVAANILNATVSDINVFCVIETTSNQGAGIIGTDFGSTIIDSCFNYGPISGKGHKGGIAATLSKTGVIRNCFNYGDITSDIAGNYQIGGIVGTLDGSVLKSANYGNILAAGRNIGGIAGQMTQGTSDISECYNVGDVTYKNGTSTYDTMGGIVGYGLMFMIENSYNYGTITKINGSISSYMGGLVGRDARKASSSTTAIYYLDSASPYAENSTALESVPSATYSAGMNKADAATFAAASGVLQEINEDGSFQLVNGKYPELLKAQEAHEHAGGTASCKKLAVCESCGLEYGDFNTENHLHTSLVNVTEAIWVYDGNTGDTVCDDCGETLQEGQAIPADKQRQAVKVVIRETGKDDIEHNYTVEEFDSLKVTNPPIGYQFGGTSKTMMVVTEYVTIERILQEFELTYDDIESLNVICDGADRVLPVDTLTSCIYYFDEDDETLPAPAAVAISYGTETGELMNLLDSAKPSDHLRFGFGISLEQHEAGTSLGGRRCVSPVTELIFNVIPEPTGVVVSGSITGYNGTANAKVELFAGTETEAAYTVEGKTEYSFESVDAGTYKLRISAEGGYLYNEYEITVGAEALTKDVEIRLLGDVNKDGSVNMDDSTYIARHVVHMVTITDEYSLRLADTDKSGQVNMDDSVHLARYIVHMIPEL